MQQFAGQITDIELASKLGFVSLRHMAQPFLQLLTTDGDFTGLIKGFLGKGTPENAILMQEAGLGMNRAIEHMNTLRQVTGQETGEIGGTIQSIRKAIMTPLDWVMAKNRAWSAASGRLHLLEVVGRGKSDELGRMGFSADDLERLSRGSTFEQRVANVSRQDEIRAAQYMHDQVMLERPAGYMPRQYYVSQGTRLAYLLKGFGIKLTDFLYDNFIQTMTPKKVAIMGAVFPAIGSVLHDAYIDMHHPIETGQAMMRQGPEGAFNVASKYRHADGFMRYLDGMSFFGGLGIFSEVFNIVSSIASRPPGTPADRGVTALHALETGAGPVYGNLMRAVINGISTMFDIKTTYDRAQMNPMQKAKLQHRMQQGQAGPVQWSGLRDTARQVVGELPEPLSEARNAPIFQNPRSHQMQMEKDIGVAFKQKNMQEFERLLQQYVSTYHKAPPKKTEQ